MRISPEVFSNATHSFFGKVPSSLSKKRFNLEISCHNFIKLPNFKHDSDCLLAGLRTEYHANVSLRLRRSKRTTSNIGVSIISLHHTPRLPTLKRVIIIFFIPRTYNDSNKLTLGYIHQNPTRNTKVALLLSNDRYDHKIFNL